MSPNDQTYMNRYNKPFDFRNTRFFEINLQHTGPIHVLYLRNKETQQTKIYFLRV